MIVKIFIRVFIIYFHETISIIIIIITIIIIIIIIIITFTKKIHKIRINPLITSSYTKVIIITVTDLSFIIFSAVF